MSVPVVLLVHDDADFRGLYRFALERAGFRVDDTWDADDAIMLAHKGPYAIVVTDLYVDGVGTVPIVPRLRELRATLPILVVSGWVGDTDREAAAAWGATDFIPLPAEPGRLVDRVTELVGAPAPAQNPLPYTAEPDVDRSQWDRAAPP